MKKILVLGAGRSSAACITYLVDHAPANDWQVVVGDHTAAAAQERIGLSARARAISFALENDEASRMAIRDADVVISLIPASLHPQIAKCCVDERKHLLTASYVSDEMKNFDNDAAAAGLLFLNECGLDPGIDHMSAMQVIDRIKSEGGQLTSFESFTGGLIAPETDPENPWRYKFTWNPRNVVVAGQSTAKFLQDGVFKYIPYQQLFQRTTPIRVPGVGEFEGYANRDSLKYVSVYGIQHCKTVLRGTLRNEGYCEAWNILAQLGCCEDTYAMDHVDAMTHNDFISSFLPGKNAEEEISRRFNVAQEGEALRRLRWSGMFSHEKIGMEKGTPAQVLEHILDKKWRLVPGDKDFIVMWHRFRYLLNGGQKEIQSWLATAGDDRQTAMAKTVGLPLAIACKLLLQGKISKRGVVIPVHSEIYVPVLEELKSLGIALTEITV